MKNNFDLKKFLTENKLTSNSKLLKENYEDTIDDDQRSEIDWDEFFRERGEDKVLADKSDFEIKEEELDLEEDQQMEGRYDKRHASRETGELGNFKKVVASRIAPAGIYDPEVEEINSWEDLFQKWEDSGKLRFYNQNIIARFAEKAGLSDETIETIMNLPQVQNLDAGNAEYPESPLKNVPTDNAEVSDEEPEADMGMDQGEDEEDLDFEDPWETPEEEEEDWEESEPTVEPEPYFGDEEDEEDFDYSSDSFFNEGNTSFNLKKFLVENKITTNSILSEKAKSKKKKKKTKPSAGLSKKQKSAIVKKAKKGEDIGEKGKGFKEVAKAAGGGEKGQKIAAAAMWKNVKR